MLYAAEYSEFANNYTLLNYAKSDARGSGSSSILDQGLIN